MYESPIKVNNFKIEPNLFEKIQEDKIGKAINDAAESIAEQFDRYVLRQVAKTGVSVDRDELVKALRYDRDQYDKGYNDGVKHGIEISTPTWIPVTEMLPEPLEDVLVCENGFIDVAHYDEVLQKWFDNCSYEAEPSHWMPLPEPPKDGEA